MQLFQQILHMSVTASYIILTVILIRFSIRKFPKKFAYLLWSVVGFRLIFPHSFTSALSILNLRLFNFSNPTDTVLSTPSVAETLTPPNVSLSTNVSIETIAPSYIHELTKTAPISTPSIDLMTIVTGIWLFGCAILLIYGILSYVKLKIKLQNAIHLRNNIYENDQIPFPFVMGIVRPRIYIPFHLSEKELTYILFHEQYHIKRLDHIIKPIAFFLAVIHWFNPLVWCAYYLMCQDLEMSCDEKVIEYLGSSIKVDYTHSLLNFSLEQPLLSIGQIAFGHSGFKKRTLNILHYKKANPFIVLFSLVICIFVITACATNPISDPIPEPMPNPITESLTEVRDHIILEFESNKVNTPHTSTIKITDANERKQLQDILDNYKQDLNRSENWPLSPDKVHVKITDTYDNLYYVFYDTNYALEPQIQTDSKDSLSSITFDAYNLFYYFLERYENYFTNLQILTASGPVTSTIYPVTQYVNVKDIYPTLEFPMINSNVVDESFQLIVPPNSILAPRVKVYDADTFKDLNYNGSSYTHPNQFFPSSTIDKQYIIEYQSGILRTMSDNRLDFVGQKIFFGVTVPASN